MEQSLSVGMAKVLSLNMTIAFCLVAVMKFTHVLAQEGVLQVREKDTILIMV